jgi:hypothetical protein
MILSQMVNVLICRPHFVRNGGDDIEVVFSPEELLEIAPLPDDRTFRPMEATETPG